MRMASVNDSLKQIEKIALGNFHVQDSATASSVLNEIHTTAKTAGSALPSPDGKLKALALIRIGEISLAHKNSHDLVVLRGAFNDIHAVARYGMPVVPSPAAGATKVRIMRPGTN
jgi:hypothetical protein